MTLKSIKTTPPFIGERILALTPSYPRKGDGSDMRWRVITWNGIISQENPVVMYQSLHELETGAIFDLHTAGEDPAAVFASPLEGKS